MDGQEKRKLVKSAARVFSILWPGMGLIFYHHWVGGVLSALPHGVLAWNTVALLLQEWTDIGLLIVALFFLAANWGTSLVFTEKIEPDDVF